MTRSTGGSRLGATDAAIAEGERQLSLKFSAEYVDFLRLSNGGEGFFGENAYLVLWRVEDLASMNGSYEVPAQAPGLLIFGSDGAGEAYGFDTRTSKWTVVRVPFVGMAWSEAKPIGESFRAFLDRLHEVE